MGKRAPQSPSNSTWNLNLIHLVSPPLRFLWNLNSLHLISRQHSLLFLRWVHMKARLCHLHSPLDMKTYSFLEKRSRTVEKRAVCVHCVIFPPINTAGGYYIFNGYSINCSSFFSLSGAEELFDLMFRPPPPVWHYNSSEQMDQTAASTQRIVSILRSLNVKLLVYSKLTV